MQKSSHFASLSQNYEKSFILTNFDVFTSERLIGMVHKRCLELRVVQPTAWMPRPKVSAYFIVK